MSKKINGFKLPWQRLFHVVLGNSSDDVIDSDVIVLFLDTKLTFFKSSCLTLFIYKISVP